MPNKFNHPFFLSLQVQTGELDYYLMGFFLVFDKSKALIKYHGPSEALSSLVDSIQQCFAQRVTDITVELPTKEAEIGELFEVLSKLHGVLQKRSERLKLKQDVGGAKTQLVVDLLALGCEITTDEEVLKEIEVQKLRQKQSSTKDRALKMLEEIKSNQKKFNEFDIDFTKLYKAAEFQAWPEIEGYLEKVSAALETELRLKEKLEREKKLYVSRIHHLKKVTEVDAASAKELAKMHQIEIELDSLKAELSELTNRLLGAQDQAKKSELSARHEVTRCQKEYGPVINRLNLELERQKKK